MPTKTSKCPEALARHIESANLIPHQASDAAWAEFMGTLVEIMEPLSEEESATILQFGPTVPGDERHSEYELGRNRLNNRYKAAVRNRVTREFLPLALSLPILTAWLLEATIETMRTNATELRAPLLRVVTMMSGRCFSVEIMKRQFFVIDESGIVSEMYPGALSQIISERIPIDRLQICPICADIFWQKKRGPTRRSLTCGKKTCADTLGNRKRKKETR